MKVLIIGGAAAGTKTAAKLKREDPTAEVTLITKETEISYAGCGLPYFVGGLVKNRADLILNTPEKFSALTGTAILTSTEALAVSPATKTVHVRDCNTGAQTDLSYDKLVIASGASPIIPALHGIGQRGVFTLRTPDDAVAIRTYAEENEIHSAIVLGAGFIGLEVAENLHARGIRVHVVEESSQILNNVFDCEMADYIRRHLNKCGIPLLLGTRIQEICGNGTVSGVNTDHGFISGSMVVVCAGIKPNTEFLAGSGVELLDGKIKVDSALATNIPDIYAVGDCAMVANRVTGAPQWSAMGSSAKLEGRTLAMCLSGKDKCFAGVLGTGIIHLPELNCGRTGLGEEQAKVAGFDPVTVLYAGEDKAPFYPGSSYLFIKLIADRKTEKVLGVQVLGLGAVDKILDIAVTAINMNATLVDFENADYAYAPSFSTAVHPFVQAVYLLQNKLCGDMVSISPAEYLAGSAVSYRVIDVSKAPSIPGATYVDLPAVNGEIDGIAKEEKLLLVCNRGRRAYLLQNKLRHLGYTNTAVLEGATLFNEVKAQPVTTNLTDADIARVKALGFLRDKTTKDCFNCRVLTRNGKITAEESRVIADAAKKFGSGEIAMTTRLTVEIQRIPYANIEPLREYLAMAGLESGGTGSKVRPVVSCKGTTCQYGLIDTFSISEEIHERFYHGYGNVKLPHKFKIAVGGCPNNCVKPDLNDLGVIGQRMPLPDLEKCRGCNVCQVERACPMKAVAVKDGKALINADICNNCGRCLTKCPFHAFESSQYGYRIYIGGRWGKKTAHGQPLRKLFTNREEVMQTIEKAILLFREQGITGERFADTIARLGFENAEAQLLSHDLLTRKEENLNTTKHTKGGATC